MEITSEGDDSKHVFAVNRHKFADENLTDEAVMFIHSGLVSQTIHCIVQINPYFSLSTATTLKILLKKQTSHQFHRHVFLVRKETVEC